MEFLNISYSFTISKKECYLTFVYDIIITSVRYWQLLCISCRYYISFLVKGQTRQRLLAYLTRHNIKGYTSYINMNNKYSIYILVSNAKILRLMCVPFPRIYWKAIFGIMQNKKMRIYKMVYGQWKMILLSYSLNTKDHLSLHICLSDDILFDMPTRNQTTMETGDKPESKEMTLLCLCMSTWPSDVRTQILAIMTCRFSCTLNVAIYHL